MAATGAGAEVVQLYILDHQADERRPPQSLRTFSKVYLRPGESAKVQLSLAMDDLAVFCPETRRWRPRPGRYTARLGSSSRDIRLERDFEFECAAKSDGVA
jgi:beta-glucosidase